MNRIYKRRFPPNLIRRKTNNDWENSWKEYINESLIDKVATFEEINKSFKYFHISAQLLDEPTFEFTPRIPRNPFHDINSDIIEDNFTKRISIARTIEDAKTALGEGAIGWYLYAIPKNDRVQTVEPKTEDCPETPQQNYDRDFILNNWLKYLIDNNELSPEDQQNIIDYPKELSPRILPADLKDQFETCVPDADEHGELWLTEPTEMLLVGKIVGYNLVKLTSEAYPSVKKQMGIQDND